MRNEKYKPAFEIIGLRSSLVNMDSMIIRDPVFLVVIVILVLLFTR